MAIALKKIWCESADTKEHIQRHKVSMYSTKKYEREGGIEIGGKDFLPRIKKHRAKNKNLYNSLQK